MPRFYACDHCGRTGVTFGVYYPNRDMTQPALHLCQTIDGVPIEPNCYHLVTERGEELGARKLIQIRDSDRHAPKVEAVALRFTESAGGAIYTETERPGEPASGTLVGEAVAGEHPLTGQVVMNDPLDTEVHPAITEAEKGKGIIDPFGATQRPLVQPDSPEGHALADAAAAEEARKMTPPGGLGGVGDRDANPRTAGVPGRYPRGATEAQDYVNAHAGEDFDTLAARAYGRIAPDQVPTMAAAAPERQTTRPSSAAEVAAAAQARADAEAAIRPARKAPAKAPAKKAVKKSTPRKATP